MIKLGILGCGAITRVRHISSALVHPEVELSALVDADIQRAINLRDMHGLKCQIATNHREILGSVDAVINALPNHVHAPINLELLETGIHVLSEKPLAITSADALSCAETAKRKGATLAVGMPFRFRESSRILPLVLKNKELGVPRSYAWDYGVPFDWPTASSYFLSRKMAGGGVLIEEGVHLLDCLLSWFGDVIECDCQTDDWGGGLEANVLLRMRHRSEIGELDGAVRLSRTYTLKNRLRVEGETAFAEILRSHPDTLLVTRKMGDRMIQESLSFPKEANAGSSNPFLDELNDFIQAIQKKRAPLVDGWEAARTLDLIERCYATATRIPEPWATMDERRSIT